MEAPGGDIAVSDARPQRQALVQVRRARVNEGRIATTRSAATLFVITSSAKRQQKVKNSNTIGICFVRHTLSLTFARFDCYEARKDFLCKNTEVIINNNISLVYKLDKIPTTTHDRLNATAITESNNMTRRDNLWNR